jgi:hypothetical protein
MMYLLTLFPITCLAVCIGYLLENRTNHIGVEFLQVLWPLFFCAILALLLYKLKNKRRFLVPVLVNFSAMAFFYGIDHFNILVQYDEWCDRGMPSPFMVLRKSDTLPELDEKLDSFVTQRIYRDIVEYNVESDRLLAEYRDKWFEKKMEALLERFNEGEITRETYEQWAAQKKAQYERDKIRDKEKLMKWQGIRQAVDATKAARDEAGREFEHAYQ